MNSLKEKNMADPLLKVDHVTISYNGEPTVRDVSFELKAGRNPWYRRRIRKWKKYDY